MPLSCPSPQGPNQDVAVQDDTGIQATRYGQLSPREWLERLVSLFPENEFQSGDFEFILPGEVPTPYDCLLVHDHHMTVNLEAYHGEPVALHVLQVHDEDPIYARKLYLTAGEHGPVVMAGIMQVWLQHLRPRVRERITGAKTPLGRILVEHRVLRHLQPMAFFSVRPRDQLARIFGCPAIDSVTYGRLAMIFCDGEPAVEVLEIAAPTSPWSNARRIAAGLPPI